MYKLNFGCGDRIADGWINIDFHSDNAAIRRVNLLTGFPFPDNYFSAVYSSHVLEHFTPEQALSLLSEAYRVLKPGGILRIVVPDLREVCQEYLRILQLSDKDPQKAGLYEWITIELLDQLVRSRPTGEMGAFLQKPENRDNRELQEYVHSRVGRAPAEARAASSLTEKLRKLTPEKLATKFNYFYLRCVGKLIPKNLRSMVLVETGIGERHRWMYDFYGLCRLCEKAGFSDFSSLDYSESGIPDFHRDCLDSHADGTIYKPNSIFLEALKKPLPA